MMMQILLFAVYGKNKQTDKQKNPDFILWR